MTFKEKEGIRASGLRGRLSSERPPQIDLTTRRPHAPSGVSISEQWGLGW